MADRCMICAVRPASRNSTWCSLCSKSYETSTRKDDGTIRAAIDWAAKRSRWFAVRYLKAVKP